MEHNTTRAIEAEFGLFHDLLNDLMILIGECDLLHEDLPEYHHSKRIRMIREVAVRMCARIAESQLHDGAVDVAFRLPARQPLHS